MQLAASEALLVPSGRRSRPVHETRACEWYRDEFASSTLAVVTTTFVYDPTSADFQDNFHEVYRVLRDEHPVYRDPVMGSYSISRFEDVWDAVHDPETFSSAGVAEAETLPGLIIYLDDPHHAWLRAIVSRAFTPKRIADLEPRVRELAATLVDASIGQRGRCDVVHDLAAPLPSTVIAELLGVPAEHVASFRSWTEEFIGIASVDDFAEAAGNIFRLAGEILDERRRAPRDDLISALLAAEVDGRRLSDEDLLGFCFNLIIAGNDTTTSLIENGVSLLARHPDQRAELVEEPSLMPGRDRGDGPDRLAGADAPADGDTRRHAPRRRHPDGVASPARVGRRQPRRARVPGSHPVRHPPDDGASPRLRPWDALLPGRRARAARGACRVRGAPRPRATLRDRRGA